MEKRGKHAREGERDGRQWKSKSTMKFNEFVYKRGCCFCTNFEDS